MKNLEVNKTVKFALLIEYDGNNLVGWQKQNKGISVQGSLEEAAKNIFNQAPSPIIKQHQQREAKSFRNATKNDIQRSYAQNSTSSNISSTTAEVGQHE